MRVPTVHHRANDLPPLPWNRVNDRIYPKRPLKCWKRQCMHLHWHFKKKKVLVTKLCPTLCDSMDCSPLSGDYIARLLSVHVILQARILEWVAISSSGGSFQPRDQNHVSCIGDIFFTPWAIREGWHTSHHKLGGLKQWKFILPKFWKLKVESKVSAGPFSHQRLLGRLLHCLFQFLMAPGILWLLAT